MLFWTLNHITPFCQTCKRNAAYLPPIISLMNKNTIKEREITSCSIKINSSTSFFLYVRPSFRSKTLVQRWFFILQFSIVVFSFGSCTFSSNCFYVVFFWLPFSSFCTLFSVPTSFSSPTNFLSSTVSFTCSYASSTPLDKVSFPTTLHDFMFIHCNQRLTYFGLHIVAKGVQLQSVMCRPWMHNIGLWYDGRGLCQKLISALGLEVSRVHNSSQFYNM